MALKRMDEIAAGSVPKLAGSIIAASDELVSIFIEAAVGERQNMALEFLD